VAGNQPVPFLLKRMVESLSQGALNAEKVPALRHVG
jgi:hypothetical protein